MRSRTWVAIIGLALGIVVASEVGEAWARARGGGGGGRGSRSFSTPSRPASPASPTTPSSPSRSLNQPAAPVASARPSMFRGLMGGLAGFALGGLLGSMLFGGFGGLGGLGGGIGLLDILLIGGGLVLLFMFLRRRRAETPQPAYAGMGAAYGRTEPEPVAMPGGGATATMEAPVVNEVERGIDHIRQMDPGFAPDVLTTTARNTFFDVQAALTSRDLGRVREHVTPEMAAALQGQIDQLRAARRTNRMERVDIRRSDITEAWQESGRDYVTVYLAGSLIDCTVDDSTGAVVGGSATERESFEEFWTFSRPVGPNPWRLSAIQTA